MPENRFEISDVFNIPGIGPVPVGKVVSGTISSGMTAKYCSEDFTIEYIEQRHQKLHQATEGMNVGLKFKGKTNAKLRKGDVLLFE